MDELGSSPDRRLGSGSVIGTAMRVGPVRGSGQLHRELLRVDVEVAALDESLDSGFLVVVVVVVFALAALSVCDLRVVMLVLHGGAGLHLHELQLHGLAGSLLVGIVALALEFLQLVANPNGPRVVVLQGNARAGQLSGDLR